MLISYTFGVADLFHYGHLQSLKQAHEGADLLVFGLVSDIAAKKWIGNIVSTEQERMAVLESNVYVDVVLLQDTMDPTDNIKLLHKKYPQAQITVYHGSDLPVVPAEKYIKSINGRIKILNYYERLSPVNIVNTLTKQSDTRIVRNNIISTKANTLEALKQRLSQAFIEDMYIITVEEAAESFEQVYEHLLAVLTKDKVVVRSSSRAEDSYKQSNAGHYETVLNVALNDKVEVKKAIYRVIDSYRKDNGVVNKDEQVLMQNQTDDVRCSGVIFTTDLKYGRPYYVISYEDDGSTDAVTSGIGGKQIYIARNAAKNAVPCEWQRLMNAVYELEALLNGMLLDIEFAIKTSGEVVIFQVRPLAAAYKLNKIKKDKLLFNVKDEVITKYQRLAQGANKHIFSDMAFWNPAEIIGDNIKGLEYSIYRDIITRRAWSLGIADLGYKLVDDDLMYRFGNKPYINLENSFKALLPNDLSEKTGKKLLVFYSQKLKKDFSAHDKIEFEIVYSCFDFQFEKMQKELLAFGFEFAEVREIEIALWNITINAINNYKEILAADTEALKILEKKRATLTAWDMKDIVSTTSFENIYELCQSIIQNGTIQFARQARLAFIAKSLCRGMIAKGYFSEADMDSFMKTIHTVATDFEHDFVCAKNDRGLRQEFLHKYGHLRAGTYDIESPRYDAMEMFSAKSNKISLAGDSGTLLPLDRLQQVIDDYRMPVNAYEFLYFLQKSFEQREWFKFIFTKSLSDMLEMIARLGNEIGISRSDLAYLSLSEIMSGREFQSVEELFDFWHSLITTHKERHKVVSQLIMPSVIGSLVDFDFVKISDSRPNFITDKVASAEVAVLTNLGKQDIMGKIVVVDKADPGYDWIFAEGIAGLVTKYGGVASHMAIRAAEFGIPAAIGCGERIYGFAINAEKLCLDCKKGRITD